MRILTKTPACCLAASKCQGPQESVLVKCVNLCWLQTVLSAVSSLVILLSYLVSSPGLECEQAGLPRLQARLPGGLPIHPQQYVWLQCNGGAGTQSCRSQDCTQAPSGLCTLTAHRPQSNAHAAIASANFLKIHPPEQIKARSCCSPGRASKPHWSTRGDISLCFVIDHWCGLEIVRTPMLRS